MSINLRSWSSNNEEMSLSDNRSIGDIHALSTSLSDALTRGQKDDEICL